MSLFARISALILCLFVANAASSQKLLTKRSTFYVLVGTSGAKLNQFDQMLSNRGVTGIRNKYRTIGLGYQTRFNDFVLGLEVLHNTGAKSQFDDYRIGYRTSRALLNIGYSFTEESRFQLIHFMSMGVGFLNFQMLPETAPSDLDNFLTSPQEGFILRKKDIQKGSQQYGNFLTEIGFQMSYDFDLPRRAEAIQIMAKVGYSFSPLAGRWNMAGINFDNTQSGAFLRLGAGISMPDRNFFYKDGSIGVAFIRGIHFTQPDGFNARLVEAGITPLKGAPSNWGFRVFGDIENLVYGAEIYNLAMPGDASSERSQSLNSIRVYANAGYKVFQFRSFGVGAQTGVGFGNIRYSNLAKVKPDFPELFEKRKFDGYLKNSGLMLKPEVFLEYGIPMTKRKSFDLVVSASVGYEVPLANYRLADYNMSGFMSAPYLSFGVGVRP